MPDEEVVHRYEGVLNGPPEVAEVRLPVAEHGGHAEDEVALADVVADAVAVHDERAEAHERLGGAAHLEGKGGKIDNSKISEDFIGRVTHLARR